jgi:hypothetical protein
MKTNFLFVMLLMSIRSFSQECPCVKTAIIGTDARGTTIHNNKIVAMDNATIKLGESINLYTKENTGKTTWYKNKELIDDTNVSPTETIEYIVKSTLKGCPDAVATVRIQVDKSSIDEADNQVAVFPNPTNDFVSISSNNKELKRIDINNLLGEKVKSFQVGNHLKQQTLNISDLLIGVYLITVEIEGGIIITKKLIKN